VAEPVASAFTERLAARADALVVGDPTSPETQIGPMALPGAAERMAELVADARENGAKLAAGGEREDGRFSPTVLTHVSEAMRVSSEEIFGPIVTVRSFATTEEAIALANDSACGLSGAVFGRDVGAALAVARRLETGMCHIDGATVHDEAQMPFGGVKASGWGRFGSRAAVEEFTELRWITVSETPRHYPI
jgi:acyl-CoA reductase-like NAD-dependent aldehyde dehydrogenase